MAGECNDAVQTLPEKGLGPAEIEKELEQKLMEQQGGTAQAGMDDDDEELTLAWINEEVSGPQGTREFPRRKGQAQEGNGEDRASRKNSSEVDWAEDRQTKREMREEMAKEVLNIARRRSSGENRAEEKE